MFTTKDEHVVDKLFNVVDLMGGDDDRALLCSMGSDDAAELTLGFEVETVGGFVHQQVARVGGQGKGHQRLLLLTHRELADVELGRKLELREALLEDFVAEARIEDAMRLHILAQGHRWKLKLLWNEIDVGQSSGLAGGDILPIGQHTPALRTQQPRQHI